MRVVIAPPVPALLPDYAGREDPVGPLRAALTQAVAWLGDGPMRVVAQAPSEVDRSRGIQQSLGARIALSLGLTLTDDPSAPLLVFASGSAMRTEKAPGFFDERAAAFDAQLDAAIRSGKGLSNLDLALGEQLWAQGLTGLVDLAGAEIDDAQVDYADAPYGVAYWVARWQLKAVSSPADSGS